MIDPPFQPWLVPHSCGQVCGKDLVPSCGHSCLLLCHPGKYFLNILRSGNRGDCCKLPCYSLLSERCFVRGTQFCLFQFSGPCPPCPKMIRSKCYCSNGGEKMVRCCYKEWSCGQKCSKKLSCQKHKCETVCHPGECPACPKTSMISCDCQNQSRMTACAELSWKCEKVWRNLNDFGLSFPKVPVVCILLWIPQDFNYCALMGTFHLFCRFVVRPWIVANTHVSSCATKANVVHALELYLGHVLAERKKTSCRVPRKWPLVAPRAANF